MRSIPEYLKEKAAPHLERPALRFSDGATRQVVTYRELGDQIDRFARGLRALGVKQGDRVFLLADNSPRWLIADLGILRAGAVAVPRGADTNSAEIEYILEHSGATAVVAENPRLLDRLPDYRLPIKVRVSLVGERENAVSYDALLEKGESGPTPKAVNELATIVYTSGTTGTPKGVMLTHDNILHNVRALPELIHVETKDRFLSVLPSWHMFERTCEYAILASGATLSYSSLRTLKDDLQSESPTFVVGVPRLWQGIHDSFFAKLEKKSPFAKRIAKFLLKRTLSWTRHRATLGRRLEDPRGEAAGSRLGAAVGTVLGAPLGWLGRRVVGGPVRAAAGGRLRGAVSGGGMLNLNLDVFLEALGLPILVGYGLTETSPCVTVRLFEDNVLGTIGRALPETEIRIVDDEGKLLPVRQRGHVEVRGPQVMPGYYSNEEATREVLSPDGWFHTGDLGSLTEKGDIVFTGRAKETIVLAGGENIEPRGVESRILESPYVKQAMVVGQDRKNLGVLLVADPEQAPAEAERRGITVEKLLRAEVLRLVTVSAGFKPRELVGKVAVLDEDFSVENDTLTRTLKLKRNVILEKFRDRIDGLYESGAFSASMEHVALRKKQ